MPKDERVIRFYGIHNLPAGAISAKWIRHSLVLLRSGSNTYQNDKTLPSRFFHGYFEYMRQDNVCWVAPYEFSNQQTYYKFNEALYLHTSISCALEAVLTSFVNFGLALGLPPIQRNNPIKGYKNPVFSDEFDQVRIRLRVEEMVVKSIFEWEEQEVCSVPLSEPPQFNPPAPPPPPPSSLPLPPDSPDSSLPPISPPYSSPDDSGLTYNPGDGGDGDLFPACTSVRVTFMLQETLSPDLTERVAILPYPVSNLRVSLEPGDSGDTRSWVVDTGVADSLDCPLTTARLISTVVGATDGEIVSIVPV